MDTKKAQNVGKKVATAWKVFLWVLRWLSIILFGMLFFIGIYFKLPTKVLACIAVIPLVGLFVPRKKQPWIWAGLTVVLLSLWGWVHLPEQASEKWTAYQYRQELLDIKRDYLQRGVENAADRYEAVFAEHGEDIFFFVFRNADMEIQTRNGPWDPKEYPFLDFWLTQFEPAVGELIKASQIEQCRFEIPYDLASMKPQMRRIHEMKGWTRLMMRSAFRDLFTGNQEQALEKMMAPLGIAQHLYQQETLFDQSAAFEIELIAARALETFIIDHCDDPKIMASIEDRFARLNPQWARNWQNILLREKLIAKNLAALMYEANPSGRVRISHNAMMALQEGLGYRPQRLFLNQQAMNRLAVIGLWLSLPMSPERLADIVDERFDHYSLKVQRGEKLPKYGLQYVWVKGLNAQSVIDWLAMQQVGYFWALDGQFYRHSAVVNQIYIFTALKRYHMANGQWPRTLEELNIDNAEYVLTDPVYGKPFVYERTDKGFRFYSLGRNGVDDDGINDKKNKKDDILLWPRNVSEDETVSEDVENKT